jgi:glucose/arabinose dehydrogenase
MRKALLAALFFLLITVLCFAVNQAAAHSKSAPQAPPTQTQVTLTPVLTGLSGPVFVTNAHDGSNRLFIVEQAGRIKVVQPGSTTPTVFLDITSRVLSGGEQGLLGLTFHPNFSTNHHFYVDYTRKPDGATVIAEYQVPAGDSNVADTTEKVLLVIPQPFANHNGGMVEFGPDGFLYIGMGDGGSANDPGNRAQNINELLGKILRIDVDHANGSQPYSSPATNPFFGATAGADEIYAYGLRNPWRFSFDHMTGQLYIGDVGQDAHEEVDIGQPGGNYGWRIFEGKACTNNDPSLCATTQAIAPIATYDHTGGRCSITGGYVYSRGDGVLPTGAYLYADYCTGEIFMLQNGTSTLLTDTSFNITSFGEDEARRIYVVGQDGTISRFEAIGDADILIITEAVVRKRATGKVLNPVTVKANAKKFDIVVAEDATAPSSSSAGAHIVVNGKALDTTYTTNEAGSPIFVAHLKAGMLSRPGALTVQVVRTDNVTSNVLAVPIVAAAAGMATR